MKTFLPANRTLLTSTFLLVVMMYSNFCRGQVTLYTTDFGTTTALPAGWTPSSADWANKTDVNSTGYTGASAGSNVQFLNATTTAQTFTYSNNLSTVGYQNVTVLWGGRLTNAVAITIALSWSSDGAVWNNISFTNVANGGVWALVNGGTRIALPAGAAGIANLRLRLTATPAAGGSNTSYRVDDFTVQGTTTGKIFTGTGNFSTAARWTGGTLPAAGDNLIIDGACTVDNAAGTDNLAYGTLTIGTATGRTLNWAAGGTNRLNVSNLNAGSGGANNLNMANGGTLILRNAGGGSLANLAFTPGTGTLEIQSGGGLYAGYPTYNNLIVNGTGITVSLSVATAITGNLTIAAGTLNSNNFDLSVSGNWTNNGSFTAGAGGVTFNSSTSKTVTGSSTTAFNTITVNKGTDNSSIIDVQSVITMLPGGLTLTNGTFKLSSNSTITPWTAEIAVAPYNIPATAGLWVNGGTVSTTSQISFAGLVRASAGILNVGDAIDERFYLRPGSGAIIVDGGTVNIASRLSYANTTDVLSFTMSSGTFNVGTVGNIAAVAPFTIFAAASSFTMSGGTIVIVKPGGSNVGYYNAAGTSNVTGGTLQIGNASTPAANTMQINSTVPIWNLSVNNTNAPVAQLAAPLVVKNDIIISGGTLQTNNFNLTVAGNWVNNGTFSSGTETVMFNGTTTVMSGTTTTNTFNNLTVAASSTVTSSAGITGLIVNGTLTTGASAILDLGTATILSGTLGSIANSGTVKTAVATTTSATPIPSAKTWAGTVDYYNASANQTIAGGTYNNLTVRPGNSRVAAASGNIAVDGTLTVTTGFGAFDLNTNVLSGALTSIVNIGDIRTAVPTSTSALPIPAGKSWGGTIVYNAVAGAQTIVGGTYNILRFLNTGGTNTAAGDLIVNNQFITTVGGTLDMGTAYRLINLGGTITNNGIVKTSVLTSTSTTPFPAGKTWGGTGTVEYAAASGAQTVMSGTFNNLKLSNTSGTNTVSGNVTLNGILTLTGGTLTTNTFVISLNSTATVSRTAGHVIGNFKKHIAAGATTKTFEIGDAANYTPVTVAFASVTTADYLTASVIAGDHANIATSTINSAYTANRNWTLTNQSIAFTTCDVTFTFVAGDLDGSATPGNFGVGRYNAGWTYPTVGTKTSTTTQATGVAAFGDFQLGEICYPPTTAAAGADQTGAATCGITTVTLAGNTPTVGTGSWSIISGSGGAVTTPASATSTFSGVTGNTYTLRWTISNSPCTASTDDVLITFTRISNNQIDYTNGTKGVLCATVAENGTAAMTAPAGMVFIHIGFASYGTPAGSCGAFTYGNCHAAASQAIAENYFLGNNSGSLPATNAIFGDPCSGTVKQLYVQATYTQPVCSGTSPGIISGTLPTGGNGIYTYLWEQSTVGATSGFSAASGTNNAKDYTAGTLTQTTWYRRTVTSGSCTNVSGILKVLVTTMPAATIAYGGSPFCKSLGSSQPVTLSGTTGGTYSSTAGLTINASTGAITPGTSTEGTYIVTYSMAATGGCPAQTATATVTVAALPTATISYSGTPFCKSSGTGQTVTQTGTAGGTYSSTAGLTIDISTGTIMPATSVAGTYTVTYTMTAQGCADQTATTTVTVTPVPNATFSYAGSPYMVNAGTASATFSGTTGGTYSSTAGLSINATTGDITLGTSTVGTYTVTYSIAAANGCSAFTTTTTITIVIATKTFTGTGNFSDPARWTGGTLPTAGENLIIDGACTVDNDAGTDNVAYGNLTLGTATGRTLNWATGGTNRLNVSTCNNGSGPSLLDMTNGGTLVVRTALAPTASLTFLPGTGTVEIQPSTTLPAAPNFNNLVINGPGKTVTLSAATSLSGNLIITAGTFNTNNFNISVAGNWINNVSTTAYTSGTSTVTFNGTAAQSIGGAFATTFRNLAISNTASTVTLNINASIAGNLSVTSGIFDLGIYTADRTAVGGTLSLSNNTTLKIGGTNTFPINYSTNTLVVASTVMYAGTNQTIAAKTYGNLTLSSESGAAVKTFPATAFAVVGNLTSTLGTGSSVTFSAASTITITGNVTIGASTTFNGGSFSHSIAGNWVNNGIFNGNAGTITFTGAGTSVGGSGSQQFNNLTVAAAGISFPVNTINLSGNLATTGSGSFTQASGGTLTMTGTSTTISGSGIVLDNMAIMGSVNTASSLNITGNISVTGSFTSSNIVTLSGALKMVSGAGTMNFAVLSVTGTITTNTDFFISAGLTVVGSLTASAGTATFAGTTSLSGTANLFNTTVTGTSLQLSTNSVLGVAGVLTVSAGILDVTSSVPNTVNFNSTGAQSINAITYDKLTLSNGNSKTAVAGITVNHSLTIGTGTTFIPGAYVHSIYADWINNGSFIAGSSTIEFPGSQTSNITGVTTFNILTQNTNIVLKSNVSAATVNMLQGTMQTGTNSITITGTRTGGGIIIGTIQRTHAFTTGVAYAFEGEDNTITFSSVSSVTSITVSVVKGSIGDFPFGGSVSRRYTISVPVGTYTATLRLHYEDVELNGNNETSIGLWQYNGSAWGVIGKTANNTTANYVEQSGLTTITNRWTLSDNANVVEWNGSVSTDWNTAANWTVVEGAASAPPSATDIANLGSGTFTYQPTISTSVNVKGVTFGSTQAVTLSMAAGGALTAGSIKGAWSTNATHTINVNSQTITTNGGLVLSDGVSGHAINLNIDAGSVNVIGSLNQSGGANIVFTGAGSLSIANNFNFLSGTFTAGAGTVTYNGSINQAVAAVGYNNLRINKTGGIAAINNIANIAGNLLVSAGELDNYSTTTIAGNVTIDAGGTLINHVVLHVQGNWNNNGQYNAAGASIYFDGSGQQNISASTFNNFNINKPSGTATLTGDVTVTGDYTFSSGTFDIQAYRFSRNVPGGTATSANGTTFMIGANNPPGKFLNHIIGPASTTIFYGPTPLTLTLAGINFGHVIFRGTGLKTVSAPITVNGDFTIENTATLNASSATITLHGNWNNSGAFIPSSSTVLCLGAGKTITGNTTFNKITVSGSYTFSNNNTINNLLTITSTGSLSGAGTIHTTLHGDLINSGILYTLGTTTFTGNVLQTLSLLNAVQTVAITVNFNGSVSPELVSTSAPQFGFLNINNTGGVNPSVGWTIAYGMTVGNGASFNGGNSTHNILGSLTNNGTITSSGTLNFVPASAATIALGNNFLSTGTVVFGGAGAITLAGTPVSFSKVRISNTNAAGITPVSDWIITDELAVNSGAIFKAGTYHYSVGGNVTNNGTVNSGTSTFTFNGTTDQTISSMIFYNLDAMNSGGKVTLLDGTVNKDLSVTTGTLSIGDNTAARSILVSGNINLASGTTLNVDTASNTTHQLTVGGNIINSGKLNLRPDANSLCNVTFNKVGRQTISGTSDTTRFNNITVDKGVIDTSYLDVTATNFSAPNGFLTLKNGSFNLNSAAAIVTPFTADITTGNFLIPATAGLWVNAGTINSSSMNWTVAGSVKVTGGVMNMGSLINNIVIPKPAANFTITGGSLNLASRISNPGATWSFEMQGGMMTVNTEGSTAAGEAAFNMEAAGSAFNMSGGTIVIHDAGGSAGQNLGYTNLATAGAGFTGGTLQIGNAATTASQTIGINSTNPIYNLTVNSTNATAILQTPVLAVNNNVTVTLGHLNIDSLTLKIGGAISNSGTFTASRGTIEMNGSSAQTIPASAFAGNLVSRLAINNNAGVALGGTINLTDVLTVSNGSLASNGFLTLKSSATATARVAPITSASSTPISGNVIAERYVIGRRKYRLITSPVTTHANAVLTPGQEAYSIWGNWQNAGSNAGQNSGNLITGGSAADGFDQGTANASLFTYDDVNYKYVGYTSANGKNTKYTSLKAGVAYYMFVYGDRQNSVFASNPRNTVLDATGVLKTGDQLYNTSSPIPLSGVTGRFTLLGNPFASPINWATIPKAGLENSYWGWDPNLSTTGGYVTVTTLGSVTLQAPYSGTTGLNQYIQSGQGFFVKTSAPSPVLTIREQDKVSDFNGNAFRTARTAGDLSLFAVNLQYVNGASKVLADGVLYVFDPAFSTKAGDEDAAKMINTGENIAIRNDTASLSIDARQMPQNNDTLYLTASKLTKPQYTLQIFAQRMEGSGVQPYLQDRYLNTMQPLSLSDTNNIVFNVTAGVPASADINRFRIVFQSSFVVLAVNFASINATLKNKDVQVKWQVADETGVRKYEVLRSADGASFRKIGEVTARGNNSFGSYEWLDTDPASGTNHYQVRAVQVNGELVVSKIVLVKIKSDKPVIKIFPNPVKNQKLNIQAAEIEKGNYTLLLRNPQGQQVFYHVIDHPGGALNKVIYLNKVLPSGIYYVSVTNKVELYSQPIFIE